MSESIHTEKEYKGYKIELYQNTQKGFRFSCLDPDGKNVDHLNRMKINYTPQMKEEALKDLREFIDRLTKDT